MSFDPLATQKIKLEISRTADTDRTRILDLYQHMIENVEEGVKDNTRSINTIRSTVDALPDDKKVKDMIAAALMVDQHARNEAAKTLYGRIFWKIIFPAAVTTGSALSALFHHFLSEHR